MSLTSFRGRKRAMSSYKKLREKNVSIRHTRNNLEELFDQGTYHAIYEEMETVDPLAFPDYKKKLKEQQDKTDTRDAVIAGYGKIDGTIAFAAYLSKDFFMGSMGTVVGETLTRTIEAADRHHTPLIIFSASGGARMQEGLFSLMQMAKTSAAIQRFRDNGNLYISVLMHPTTGGVSASYSMLGDIILAEPGALIGFAGPRVIEQTIGQKLPEGFQRAEFQLDHGFVDKIVPREEMRDTIAQILKIHRRSVRSESRKIVHAPRATEGGSLIAQGYEKLKRSETAAMISESYERLKNSDAGSKIAEGYEKIRYRKSERSDE